MEIAPTSAAGSQASTTAASASAAALDYNAFLRLLIAQMQYQDPTNPTDSAEYMGQLASFSSVEQAIRTNAKLDAMLTSSALAQVDGLIGRMVTSADGLVSGRVAALAITSSGPVAVLDNGQSLPLGAGITVS
jgi:flagellar basal-body rod modification protein FlgD